VFNVDQRVSSVGFQSCQDFRVSVSDRFGPFEDIDSFYRHLLRKVKKIAGESREALLFQKLISLKPSHKPCVVFSHADLAPQNILIHRGKITGIIDWEQSGWWPYWWEYGKALYCLDMKENDEEEWTRFVKAILDVNDEERDIDEEIRDIEGFPY
jgi:aminoglycoside phosphotransferase (APT) family kinase protein